MIWYIIIGLVGSVVLGYFIPELWKFSIGLLAFIGVWIYIGYELIRFP